MSQCLCSALHNSGKGAGVHRTIIPFEHTLSLSHLSIKANRTFTLRSLHCEHPLRDFLCCLFATKTVVAMVGSRDMMK